MSRTSALRGKSSHFSQRKRLKKGKRGFAKSKEEIEKIAIGRKAAKSTTVKQAENLKVQKLNSITRVSGSTLTVAQQLHKKRRVEKAKSKAAAKVGVADDVTDDEEVIPVVNPSQSSKPHGIVVRDIAKAPPDLLALHSFKGFFEKLKEKKQGRFM